MFDDINGFFDDETFTPLQTPYRFTRTADGNRVNTEWRACRLQRQLYHHARIIRPWHLPISPKKTIERLSEYRRTLLSCHKQGITHIFSHVLAGIHGITAVQVRRRP